MPLGLLDSTTSSHWVSGTGTGSPSHAISQQIPGAVFASFGLGEVRALVELLAGTRSPIRAILPGTLRGPVQSHRRFGYRTETSPPRRLRDQRSQGWCSGRASEGCLLEEASIAPKAQTTESPQLFQEPRVAASTLPSLRLEKKHDVLHSAQQLRFRRLGAAPGAGFVGGGKKPSVIACT